MVVVVVVVVELLLLLLFWSRKELDLAHDNCYTDDEEYMPASQNRSELLSRSRSSQYKSIQSKTQMQFSLKRPKSI